MSSTHSLHTGHTPLPSAVATAWQIMASTAHLLDPPHQASATDLLGLLAIGEAMDRLVDVRPPYPPIGLGDHAPHTPTQAASCALAHLTAHLVASAEESHRVTDVRRLLADLVATAGRNVGPSPMTNDSRRQP